MSLKWDAEDFLSKLLKEGVLKPKRTEEANLQSQISRSWWQKYNPDMWCNQNNRADCDEEWTLCQKLESVLIQNFSKAQILGLVQMLGDDNTLQSVLQSIKDTCENLPGSGEGKYSPQTVLKNQATTQVDVGPPCRLTSEHGSLGTHASFQPKDSDTCFDQLRKKLGLHVFPNSLKRVAPGCSTAESLQKFDELLVKTLDDLDVLEQLSSVTKSTNSEKLKKLPPSNQILESSILKEMADSTSVHEINSHCNKHQNGHEKAKSKNQKKLAKLKPIKDPAISSKRSKMKKHLKKVRKLSTNCTIPQTASLTDGYCVKKTKNEGEAPELNSAPLEAIPSKKSKPSKKRFKNGSSEAVTSLKKTLDAIDAIIPVQNDPQPKKQKKKKEKVQPKDQGDLILMEYPRDNPSIVLRRAIENYEIKLEWKADEIDGAHVCSVYFNDILLVQALGHSPMKAREEASATALKELQRYFYTIKIKEGSNEISIHRTDLQSFSRETDLNQNNVGFKMMELMGWSGGGLGKSSQGITEPITLKPRNSRAGIGIEKKLSEKLFKKKCFEILHSHLQNDPLSDLVFYSFLTEEVAIIKEVASKLGFKSFESISQDQKILRLYQDKTAQEIVDTLLRLNGSSGTYMLIQPSMHPNAVLMHPELETGILENQFSPAFGVGLRPEQVFQANSLYNELPHFLPIPGQFQIYTSSYFPSFS